MLAVPDEIRIAYAHFLSRKKVEQNLVYRYQKWLRFYLDYSQKYQQGAVTTGSLDTFLGKLKEKKQSEQSRNEAKRAVQYYHELLALRRNNKQAKKPQETASTCVVSGKDKYLKIKNTAHQTEAARIGHQQPLHKKRETGSSWNAEYTALENTIRMKHYSKKTLRSYKKYVRDFQTYTDSLAPRLLTTEHVKGFLTSLAVEKKVSASTQNLAFNSLLFFFRHVLNKEFGKIDGIVRAKKRPYIPVVLSRSEIELIFDAVDEPYLLIVKLLYGCGLRISECLTLRVQCLNLEEGILTVHNGKGKKDRTMPIPESVKNDLSNHLQAVRLLHHKDLEKDYSGVFLFDAFERKSKNAAREFIWQWLFPARQLSKVKKTGEMKRSHLHATHVQKAIRRAVEKACLTKRVTAHTFRHSYASHLLQNNYDIRTIQELLGHSDVRTTMLYTHTVKSVTIKEARSPLDFKQ